MDRFWLAAQEGDLARLEELLSAEVNGRAALLGWSGMALLGALVPAFEADRIVTVHIIANPDKLRFAARQSAGLSRSGKVPGPSG